MHDYQTNEDRRSRNHPYLKKIFSNPSQTWNPSLLAQTPTKKELPGAIPRYPGLPFARRWRICAWILKMLSEGGGFLERSWSKLWGRRRERGPDFSERKGSVVLTKKSPTQSLYTYTLALTPLVFQKHFKETLVHSTTPTSTHFTKFSIPHIYPTLLQKSYENYCASQTCFSITLIFKNQT